MRIVEVKKSKIKYKIVKDKIYSWRQRWLNVPAEYKDEHRLIVMSIEEFIDILYNDKKRDEYRAMFDQISKSEF